METLEHRDESRVATRSPALFEAPHAIFSPSGQAMIEELSASGTRLRTERQLHPDEELILKVQGEAMSLHARVIWVKEGPPVKGTGHKTWISGCQFHPDSMAKLRLAPAPDRGARTRGLGRAALVAAAVIGAVALLVYIYLRFATFLGGG